MLTQNVYCFFDNCSQSFLPQFFLIPNDDVAKRSFKNFVSNPNFPYKDILTDLQIFKVGQFDMEKGFVNTTKEFVVALANLKEE